MKDLVNHPEHYNRPDQKECIVEMEERFGSIAVYWFSRLSAYKYRYRKGCKVGNSAEQDEMKAKWYDSKAAEMERKCKPEMPPMWIISNMFAHCPCCGCVYDLGTFRLLYDVDTPRHCVRCGNRIYLDGGGTPYER